MPSNFFESKCKSSSKQNEFGLCDDTPPPHSPAYIDGANRKNWIGVVKNPKKKNVEFYAIDNCLKITRSNGKLESTCDGVLKISATLVFVELKERKVRGWFSEGKNQIINTIKLFDANYNRVDFTKITAQVCNSLKPKSHSGRAASLQDFKDKTGVILKDDQEINIS